MINHLSEASTETTLGAEGLTEVTPQDIHLGDVNVKMFTHATTSLAQHTDRTALVEHDAELVFIFDLQQTRQINNVTRVLIESLGYDETTSEFVSLDTILVDDGTTDTGEVIHVVVLVVVETGATETGADHDGVTALVVEHEHVAHVRKAGQDGGGGGVGAAVDAGEFGAQEGGDVLLECDVHVDGAVEAARTARAAAIVPQSALGRRPQRLVVAEAQEARRHQVEHVLEQDLVVLMVLIDHVAAVAHPNALRTCGRRRVQTSQLLPLAHEGRKVTTVCVQLRGALRGGQTQLIGQPQLQAGQGGRADELLLLLVLLIVSGSGGTGLVAGQRDCDTGARSRV
mmetsp:Transcript_13850/g.35339  ORF Transcript_13850/g.35339 Transcript_13850/m.35339 type:complete len:342 (-) Transcript_13850:554-1579(-)